MWVNAEGGRLAGSGSLGRPHNAVYNLQRGGMQELAEQIRQLFEEGDEESIKYILGGETADSVEKIGAQLPGQMGERLQQLFQELPRQEEEEVAEGVERRREIDNYLEEEELEERNESFLEFLAKANEKLIYEEHFGFPFYDLVKRILLTHADSRPQPPTVKALHSQLQILYSIIFSHDVLATLASQPSLNSALTDYLCALFPAFTDKYFQFRHVYRNIKNETTQRPVVDEEEGERDGELRQVGVHEDATLELDEKEFLVRLSDSAEEFQAYEKNRSYNFLCFGLRKYQAYIGLGPIIFDQIQERAFCELLSFLSIRFIRRMVFTINRERNYGQLLPLTEPITQQDVRRVGNELTDEIAAQAKVYLSRYQEVTDEHGQAIFMAEFELYAYSDFVPRNVLGAVLDNESLPQYVWRTCKEYRHIWKQRAKVDFYLKHGGPRPQTDFLAEAEKHLAQFKEEPGKVWKEYLMVKFGFTEAEGQRSSASTRGRKRAKLDSCND